MKLDARPLFGIDHVILSKLQEPGCLNMKRQLKLW